MKTKILLPAILLTSYFLFLALSSFSQWELQYPQPTDKTLEDVCFVDDMNGWAVGKNGTIIHTEDGGISWAFQSSETTLALRSIVFTDSQTGWIVGGETQNIILQTSDGGNNWDTQTTDPTAYLNSVFFIDSNKGWAVGEDGAVIYTENGGIDWISQWLGSQYIDCNEVYFTDSMNGWIASESGLYKTSNGGIEWVEQINMDRFLSVFFINQNEGWASTWTNEYGSAFVLHTTDSFSTWDTIVESLAGDRDGRGHFSLYFKDQDSGWMLSYYCYWDWFPGCSYYLKKTTDGGDTWENVDLPYHTTLNSLNFTPEGKGSIVGDHGLIISTLNWEDQWEQNSQGNNTALYSIAFPDEMNGWAVGCADYDPSWKSGGSTVIHTSDGGTTWEEQNSNISGPLISVSFIDSNTGWAVGNSNAYDTAYLIHTTNGGLDWVVQKWDTGYSLSAVYFINATTGWIAGTYHDYSHEYHEGRVFKTMDGGTTWDQQECDSCEAIKSVFFINPDQGWAVGKSIYNTNDGGQNWTEQFYNSSGFNLTSVFFVDDENGWIVGNKWAGGGVILSTSDGGNNWQSFLNPNGLYSVYFKDQLSGLISGDDGIVLLTEDGGATWGQQNSGTDKELYTVCFASNGHGYAAGGWGTIVHSGSLILPVDENTVNKNLIFDLHFFPNPFSETTTLSFTLPQASLVSLEIYNSNGRLVYIQKEEFKQVGQHEMVLNISLMPSGIYFCILQTNLGIQTKKIIKL